MDRCTFPHCECQWDWSDQLMNGPCPRMQSSAPPAVEDLAGLVKRLREIEREINAWLWKGGPAPTWASVPARPGYDVDLTLVASAAAITGLQAENAALRAELKTAQDLANVHKHAHLDALDKLDVLRGAHKTLQHQITTLTAERDNLKRLYDEARITRESILNDEAVMRGALGMLNHEHDTKCTLDDMRAMLASDHQIGECTDTCGRCLAEECVEQTRAALTAPLGDDVKPVCPTCGGDECVQPCSDCGAGKAVK